jgi:methyl-accepting chemotaxis protein
MKELPVADTRFIQDVLDRRALLSALRAFRKGDFSVRLPMDLSGIDGEIAQIFNDVVEANEKMAEEFARICDDVGREGQINQRVRLPAATGSWADCVDSVNTLVGDLVRPSLEVARVIESGAARAQSPPK